MRLAIADRDPLADALDLALTESAAAVDADAATLLEAIDLADPVTAADAEASALGCAACDAVTLDSDLILEAFKKTTPEYSAPTTPLMSEPRQVPEAGSNCKRAVRAATTSVPSGASAIPSYDADGDPGAAPSPE